MAILMDKRLTRNSSKKELLAAIKILALDKHRRILRDEYVEWLETKLREIARLVRILERK